MEVNNIFNKNLYELLDLNESASTKDVEEKYFFKKQNVKSKDEENLLEHAYSVLTDYHKRRDYDNNLSSFKKEELKTGDLANSNILSRLNSLENKINKLNLSNLFYKNDNGDLVNFNNEQNKDEVSGYTNDKFTLNQETLNQKDQVDEYMFTKCT